MQATETFKWLLDFRQKTPPIAPAYAATIAIDASLTDTWKITSTVGQNATINATVPANSSGVDYRMIIVSDATGGDVITFGTNFRTTGTLTLTLSKVMVMTFVSDGTSLIEMSRTVAIT